MDASYEDTVYEVTGGIATITFNRPEKLNALRERGFEELIHALRRASADETVGVIVVAGAGRGFCAGGDREMAQTSLTTEPAIRTHFFDRMIEVSNCMLSAGQPVVCAVQGPCVGAGVELAAFADFVIADETAVFGYTGTELGGCNWWGAAQLLPFQVGFRRAEEILFLSERVGAAEAARIGLINSVVPGGQLEQATREFCERLLDLSEVGLRYTKAALRAVKELVLSTMSAQAELNVGAVASPALHSAFDAARDGRALSWRKQRHGLNETAAQPDS